MTDEKRQQDLVAQLPPDLAKIVQQQEEQQATFLKLLAQEGLEAIKQYLSNLPKGISLDLSGIKLPGILLPGVDLSVVDLRGQLC